MITRRTFAALLACVPAVAKVAASAQAPKDPHQFIDPRCRALIDDFANVWLEAGERLRPGEAVTVGWDGRVYACRDGAAYSIGYVHTYGQQGDGGVGTKRMVRLR